MWIDQQRVHLVKLPVLDFPVICAAGALVEYTFTENVISAILSFFILQLCVINNKNSRIGLPY